MRCRRRAPRANEERVLTVVHLRQLGRAHDAARRDLEAPLRQRFGRVRRGARPVGEVAREDELVLQAFAVLRPEAVGALCVAGVLHELVGLTGAELVLLQLPLVTGPDPVGHELVAEAGHVLLRFAGVAVGDRRRLRLVDRVRDRVTQPHVLELGRLLPVEEERRAGVQRRARDADAGVLHGLVDSERESVRRVVNVAGQHERRDLVRLALVHDDLVEVHAVRGIPAGVLHERDLRFRERRGIDLVRADGSRLLRAERILLGAQVLPFLVGALLAGLHEVVELLRVGAVERVRSRRLAQQEALGEARLAREVEVDRLVVDDVHPVDVVPDREVVEPADVERRVHVLRGERRAVAPFDARAQLELIVLALVSRGLGEPVLELLVGP